MSALIYIDLEHVHPVIDGVWHQIDLLRMPLPGQALTMLCGRAAAAEYATKDEVRQCNGSLRMCPDCDAVYRVRRGWLPSPRPRPQRHPR
ncbi:hypothetical protein DMA12_07635 [Amycolatopsis balhimycina DSM 5908]|uniref:Uncharacterized protein n=1 Tax=Amycolatopsis balhimycina DSM 5908 TaxID=1081091 RepID=A0A428WXL5_AMYBA|nr:hypothetical protein DMA12_07635 [Amycolatopsis balhimycina DSM 5908]